MKKLLKSKLVFFVSILLLFGACSGRPKKGVLSESEMVSVLTKMHTLEASLMEKSLIYNHDSVKVAYFANILHHEGITQAEFDSSVVWYTRNPKKFEIVYNKVVEQLKLQEKEVKNGKFHPEEYADLQKTKINIWDKKISFKLTPDSVRTQLKFEIPNRCGMQYGDSYVLRFLQQINPVDNSTSKSVFISVKYDNGIVDTVSAPSYADNIKRRFMLKIAAKRQRKIQTISVSLLACKQYKGKQQAQIDSVTLTRVFNANLQDSLRKVVEVNYPKSIKTPTKH